MKSFQTLFGCATGGGGHVVVAGVPYDRGTDPHRAGCAAAPALLRQLSLGEELRIADGGGALVDLARRAPILHGKDLSDLGDFKFRPDQTDDSYLDFVAQAVRVLAAEGKRPLLLGGDHLITLASLRGFARANPNRKVQVVQFDAHHDYAPVVTGSRATHATFVGHAIAEGVVERVIQMGVRGFGWEVPELPNQLRSIELDDLEAHLLPGVDVYVTIDTDGFDPSHAPAVGYPEPEGLPFSALRAVLRCIRNAKLNVIGADWTEYNPTFDTANHLTGRLVLRGLAILAQHMTIITG